MKKLPNNWNDLTFGDYMKTLSIKDIPEGLTQEQTVVYNMKRSVDLIVLLTGKTAEEINSMQSSVVMGYMKNLSFLGTEIPVTKIKHKAKKVEEITYEDFINYINYTRSENAVLNLPKILPLFIRDLTEDQILSLPTDYVFGCFFLLKKTARKYYRYSLFRTMRQIIRYKIIEMLSCRKKKMKSNS